METAHEVAIYIDRFHNLDLFQQGWYRMKISALWEDDEYRAPISPARVTQYEAVDIGAKSSFGFWKIDDVDNSFYTQPFLVKYSRQDIYLSVMVSFYIPNSDDEGPATSSVILKFELTYIPTLGNGWTEAPDSSDADLVPVHEFRIPHKALLGLHSYCPVHFDALHSALVDLTIHIVYLKAGVTKSSLKPMGQSVGTKAYDIVKASLISREILLEEVKKISNAIGNTLEDLYDTDLSLGKYETIQPSKSGLSSCNKGKGTPTKCTPQLTGILRDFLESSGVVVGNTDDDDVLLYTLSEEELFELFQIVSSQLSFIWNEFLKFHRMHRVKILDYLHDIWDFDRKAEWSIWIIHSKIEIPHRYLRSMTNDSPRHLLRISSSRKVHHDPIQNSTSQAELHRKSIAQMKINTRSIQDMHIYADPSCIPVVRIEKHVMVVPQHCSSQNFITDASEPVGTILPPLLRGQSLEKKSSSFKSGHILRAVIFVHGFQGHHLDLRLVRNQWLLLDPGAECLLSQINEDRTSGDFKEMGRRLANEVVAFLRRKLDKYSKNGGCQEMKLSFVGHSIGNIILRSALTGYWYSSNSLFNSGLWFMKRLKGMQCMHQLTFSDDNDPQNTFFYKLCKLKTLENFKNIILVSSPQDGYVPYHSARIDLCHASSSDNSKKGQVFTDMLNNCLDQIRAPTSEKRVFMRCDVNFDQSTQGRNLNTMIGRAAHIEFLENDIYARFIMWSFPELFR
ncbi:Protein FAM135A [Dichanthelium oligosanthes]|uniref:Protein FAM135A n=1 Tax=Dichanthelium oligosanthes TaxID=888268 RepID=A0A1E5V9I4_9POAL|nr:Protein FAM135A [Dichanthelium oligosanthes]